MHQVIQRSSQEVHKLLSNNNTIIRQSRHCTGTYIIHSIWDNKVNIWAPSTLGNQIIHIGAGSSTYFARPGCTQLGAAINTRPHTIQIIVNVILTILKHTKGQ